MDRTLILVKPDAFARGLAGEIIARFERKGLKIAALKRMQIDIPLAERHYAEHAEKPFFRDLVEFITSGPLLAMVLEGYEAVSAARQVIGATDPLEAAPGSIRGDYALEVQTNLVHGSDSPQSAAREVELFFPELGQRLIPEPRPKLVLASRSPQRRAILAQLGIDFEPLAPDVEEVGGGTPRGLVIENALRKANAVRARVGDEPAILGVDTAVVLAARALGKPRDEAEARAFMEALSGRSHQVWSGIALLPGHPTGDGASTAPAEEALTGAAATEVWFRRLGPADVDWYLDSGEWRERAGGYAIQGRGAALVERIAGDYWNVVGLPVAELIRLAPQLLAG